jgi:hypothetical protein
MKRLTEIEYGSHGESMLKIRISPCDGHILARLDITVLYIIFLGLKNIEFQFKTQRG